jgi:tetratricopeptide (TPR) repeat protein
MVLVQPHAATAALSTPQIEKIAKDITVRIVNSQNPLDSGSGIIIKRSSNTYTVLTAYHVVKNGQKYQILTPNGQSNQINSVKPLPETDLAVVEFTSSQTYTIAKIGNSEKATRTTTVYVAGFPAKTAAISNPELFFNKGQVNANGAAQRDGYNIIYDNDTLKGMSGGAVLNEEGEVVAIHGRADEQIISEKSQSKIVTGIGTTIYSALRQMLAVGVDVGIKPPSVIAATPKADDFYIKANEKAIAKDFRGALADYTEAIRLNPNYADAYYHRGNAFYKLGDKQKAVNDYNQVLKINPNYADAYYNRGVARNELGDKQGAMSDYNQALKINPQEAGAYNNRGTIRLDMGDNQGAISDYNQAIKINPNDANAYYNRGNARNALKDKQEAINDYTRAIKINPSNVNYYINRGVVRSDVGDNQGAINDYNQALKIDPNLAQIYNNRGIARSNLGDKQGAISDYNQALKINPNLANAYVLRGIVRFQLQEKQGAITDLQKAADLFQQQGNTQMYQKISDWIRKMRQ